MHEQTEVGGLVVWEFCPSQLSVVMPIFSHSPSLGPSVLDVFNTLLRHLRVSVDQESGEDAERQLDEEHFQEAVINTIGDFANNLPDYQKIEILMFVMGQVPLPTEMTRCGGGVEGGRDDVDGVW
jgi:hypothetical protein